MRITARKVGGFSEAKQPGDFFITAPNVHEGGARRLSFLCPCGCGDLAGIRIRDDGQQMDGAWAWDGNEEQPTCTPSILINKGHWHGYLTAGVFVEC